MAWLVYEEQRQSFIGRKFLKLRLSSHMTGPVESAIKNLEETWNSPCITWYLVSFGHLPFAQIQHNPALQTSVSNWQEVSESSVIRNAKEQYTDGPTLQFFTGSSLRIDRSQTNNPFPVAARKVPSATHRTASMVALKCLLYPHMQDSGPTKTCTGFATSRKIHLHYLHTLVWNGGTKASQLIQKYPQNWVCLQDHPSFWGWLWQVAGWENAWQKKDLDPHCFCSRDRLHSREWELIWPSRDLIPDIQ